MTPEELEQELARLTGTIDAPASAWSTITHRARVRRRRRLAMLGSGLCSLAIVAGVLAATGERRGAHGSLNPPPSPTLSQTQRAIPSYEPIPVATGPSGPRPVNVVAVVQGAGNLYDIRGSSPKLVRRLSGSRPVTDIVFTPAREGVAYAERRGCRSTVLTVQLDGSQRHPILEAPGWITRPKFSPDGRYLAYSLNSACRPSSGDVYRERVAVSDLTTAREIWSSTATGSTVTALSWSAGSDGELLLTGSFIDCCDASGVAYRFHPLGVYRRVEQRIPQTVDRCDVQAILVQGEHTLQVNGCPDDLRLGPQGQLPGAGLLSLDQLPDQVALSSNGAHALVLLGARPGVSTKLVDVPLDGSSVRVLLAGATAADW